MNSKNQVRCGLSRNKKAQHVFMKYDLHIHTKYSSCANLEPSTILKIAKKLKLNGIAVTDHNSLKGALAVSKLNKDRNFEVIRGEEIATPQAHVLGLYLNKEIKPGNLVKVLEEIKKQGGISIIAHPFGLGLLRNKLSFDLAKIKNRIDAIETFNARMFFSWENHRAKAFAEKHKIARTGGSDAHFPFEIGNGITIFDDNLRKAIKAKKTKTEGTILFSYPGRLFSVFEMYLIKKFK